MKEARAAAITACLAVAAMPSPLASLRPARTQAMRRAETRARLLDATVESLIELGYAGTTTPIVCQRAGLSRGALLHHFPTKVELVIAAVAHLADQTVARVQRISCPPPGLARAASNAGKRARAPAHSASGARAAEYRLEQGLEVMWESFSGPLFYAALELWVAARTDAELHRHLLELERTLGKAIAEVCENLMAQGPERRSQVDDQIDLALHLLRGMALQRILRRDDAERRRLFELWKRMVTRELAP